MFTSIRITSGRHCAAKATASSPEVAERLCDLGEGRIAEMDAAGIDVQVVSLTAPGAQAFPAADAASMASDLTDAGFASRTLEHVMDWKRAKLVRNLGNALDALNST